MMRTLLLACASIALAAAGCHRDMYDDGRLKPLEPSRFFDDGQSARPIVPGTIARGQLPADEAWATGKREGEFVEDLPVELTPALLNRGRERFDIFCSNCHGRTGDGNGMIVERGFRRPPSFHTDRLRGVPVGHFYSVITSGFGAMPSYAHQIAIDDRWAIVAYLRALQYSRHARADDLTEEEKRQLEEEAPRSLQNEARHAQPVSGSEVERSESCGDERTSALCIEGLSFAATAPTELASVDCCLPATVHRQIPFVFALLGCCDGGRSRPPSQQPKSLGGAEPWCSRQAMNHRDKLGGDDRSQASARNDAVLSSSGASP